jgi:hypothetical protein
VTLDDLCKHLESCQEIKVVFNRKSGLSLKLPVYLVPKRIRPCIRITISKIRVVDGLLEVTFYESDRVLSDLYRRLQLNQEILNN